MRVLIVKLSSLGDVVHTLPVVQDILLACPNAQVDWVIEKAFAPLLRRCKGIDRVLECEIRRWSKSPLRSQTRKEWAKFKAELQRLPFDAVLDLQGLSKSALVSWLAPIHAGGHRFALANQTEGSGFEAPTRWAADVLIPMTPHIHAVERGRLLAALSLGFSVQDHVNYGLEPFLSVEKSAINFEAIRKPEGKPCVALVHGTSRADKEWPVSHWLDLARRIQASNLNVALVHGTEQELKRSQAMARDLPGACLWPRLGLDQLTDALSSCAGVIGVDSGVSHMAVALDLPHVQIYNFDTAWRTGPTKVLHQKSVYASPAPSVDEVWQAWQAVYVPLQTP